MGAGQVDDMAALLYGIHQEVRALDRRPDKSELLSLQRQIMGLAVKIWSKVQEIEVSRGGEKCDDITLAEYHSASRLIH